MDKIIRPVLDDTSLVRVSNEFGGVVTYKTERISKTFLADTFKDIPLSELKEVCFAAGQSALFTKGYLMIKDERARAALNLEPLGKTNMDEPGMKVLLSSGKLDEIEEFLQYCSNENLDKLLKVAVEMPIKDLDTANLIQAYTKINLIAVIRDRMEDQVAETGVRQRVDGKAPENPATPVRGRQIQS